MKNFVLSALFVMLFLGTACNNVDEKSPKEEKPSKVELRNADGSYRLFVNDELFFVKGAGVDNGDIALLAEQGANAFRTWSVSEEVLNEARESRAHTGCLYMVLTVTTTLQQSIFISWYNNR